MTMTGGEDIKMTIVDKVNGNLTKRRSLVDVKTTGKQTGENP